MVASPKPREEPEDHHLSYDELLSVFAQVARDAANDPRFGGGGPTVPPPSPEKVAHNEITKLKANTVNAAAVACFIGGGIAPLVGVGVTGFTILQAILGFVWFFVGLVLHSIAQNVLKGLLP